MTVEDSPRFDEWKVALEQYVEVVQAKKDGRASDKDVEKIWQDFLKISDEVCQYE